MPSPREATKKSGPASSKDSPSRNGERRFSSSSDLWPEVPPKESSRRAAHRKKSLSTTRDQLLYLQALFPYAPYDELMSIISKTDSPDEAAQHAYEALNPNYTGYLYLKEQTDVMKNPKLTQAQRATAFDGLKEALEERASDAFRPGKFNNLSHLQEYHETVGIFAVDTTEWDRAMLLPARDLAELAFMELPLRKEPSPSSSIREDQDVGKGHDQRVRPRLLSFALHGSNASFMNSDFVRPRASSFDTGSLPTKLPPREKAGETPRNSYKTLIAGGDTHESGQRDQDCSTTLFMHNSDPECKAPIIAWAPEAIRVGPAEALRQQQGALRVFDEATFFRDPLLTRKPSSILLQTPQPRASATPSETATVPARSGAARTDKPPDAADLIPLLAVSPNPSPRTTTERHEPVDSPSNSLPFIGRDEEGERDQERKNDDSEDEDGNEGRNVEKGKSGNCAGNSKNGPTNRKDSFTTAPSELSRKMVEGGNQQTPVSHHPDHTTTHHTDAPAPLMAQAGLRETTVETLKTRKRRPLTSSEKVQKRMRKLKPVGNLVFCQNTESSPLSSATERVFSGDDPRATLATSHSTCTSANALENTLHTEYLVQQAVSMTRNNHFKKASSPPALGNASQVFGSAAAESRLSSSHVSENRCLLYGRDVVIPAAHPGCSSLDPAAYLNSEEARWNDIVDLVKPFEDVFGAKFRCELVRRVHDDCHLTCGLLTELLQRLLHVLGMAAREREVAAGYAEEPMDLPIFGSILLSTSPVKVQELVFRTEKCELKFCEEGTRLRIKVNLKKVKFEPIQFAYINEAAAARQNRDAQQSRRKAPQPRSRAAAWTWRHSIQEKYKSGVTRGTATISATNVKLKGVMYVWLLESGKLYVAFQEAEVSVGSLHVSTDVQKLNVLFTLSSPVLKYFVERIMLDAVKGTHTF